MLPGTACICFLPPRPDRPRASLSSTRWSAPSQCLHFAFSCQLFAYRAKTWLSEAFVQPCLDPLARGGPFGEWPKVASPTVAPQGRGPSLEDLGFDPNLRVHARSTTLRSSSDRFALGQGSSLACRYSAYLPLLLKHSIGFAKKILNLG